MPQKIVLFFFAAIAYSSCIASERAVQFSNNMQFNIAGITIINDKLWIDGVEVKRGTRIFKSPQSKTIYRIDWKDDGNISVEEVKSDILRIR